MKFEKKIQNSKRFATESKINGFIELIYQCCKLGKSIFGERIANIAYLLIFIREINF